jgi:hypothetical protein
LPRGSVACGNSRCDLQEGVALRRCHGLKAFRQVDSVTLRQQPDAAGDGRSVDARGGVVMAVEIPDVHFESARYVRQPARRDTIRPVLVFLHLLEGDAELFS